METFQFNTYKEFNDKFSSPEFLSNPELAAKIREAIEKGMQKNTNSVDIFKVAIDDIGIELDISIGKKEWPGALQRSIDIFHKNEQFDEALDTWELLEVAKAW